LKSRRMSPATELFRHWILAAAADAMATRGNDRSN
jgi:hypothetical protein